MLEVGCIVENKYCVLKTINLTGKHSVYLAIDTIKNKTVTLHEFLFDKDSDSQIQSELIAHYDLIHKLDHPGIIPKLIDVITMGDNYVFVEEYWEGQPLSKLVEDSGAQSENEVILWARQLCDILGYLHSRTPALIYRDMKPANVFLKPCGELMLIINFGSSITTKKLNNSINNDNFNFPDAYGYAAPEQYGGRASVDVYTDIYGLGATLYYLATGHDPGKLPYEIYPIRHRNSSLSQKLEYIIQKCTKISPKDRYQSCAELLYDLDFWKRYVPPPDKKLIVRFFRSIKNRAL